MRRFMLIVPILVVIMLLVASCAAPTPVPTPVPPTAVPATAVPAAAATAVPTAAAPATAVPATAAPAAGGGATAGALAEKGAIIFAQRCAGCHGAQGQGANAPALVGANAKLAKYETAAGLYKKISTTMPKSAPGSLQPDEYHQVLAFALLSNKLVQPDQVLDDAALAGIKLQ